MKNVRMSLWMLSLGFLVACGNEQVREDDKAVNTNATTTTTTNEATATPKRPVATLANESDSAAYARERNNRAGVRETGQYNSHINRPEPPNTDRIGQVPEHAYGDTADRMDGVNSVR